MKGILILGANSDIAKAAALEYKKHGFSLILASRNTRELETLSKEYSLEAEVLSFDAEKDEQFEEFLNSIKTDYDTVLCAFGFLPKKGIEITIGEVEKTISTNYTSAVKILSLISKRFIREKKGLIIGISSVAGDRGKQSTLFYGSAKAGFTSYLAGLRNSLQNTGVHVLTVKPGYVRTKMLEGIETPDFLTASPMELAKNIYKAGLKKQNVLYVKAIWRPIMFIIQHIPEFIFKRLKL